PLEALDLWVQDEGLVVTNLEPGAEKRRVGLAGRRESHANRIEVRDEARDRPEEAGHRDRPDRFHPAPALEPAEGPERDLLQRDDVGRVEAGEPHHALQIRPARL